jgi:hypothetical protein
MGDGFVAGRFNAAGELLGGMDSALFHGAILAWGFRGKNFAREVAAARSFAEPRKPVRLGSFGGATVRQMLAIFSLALSYYLVREKV